MRAPVSDVRDGSMRQEVTKERLRSVLKSLARSAPPRGDFRVYLVGGGTAVYLGWRASSVDVDLFSEQEVVFRDIQKLKETLNVNVEFARPENFVPALKGTMDRHVFIEKLGSISFLHYDPYSQVFSKIVRGFKRDVEDSRHYVESGWVQPRQLQALVRAIPESAFARYPTLTKRGIEAAVDGFLAEFDSN